jgi:hypothetical protein
VLCPANWQEQHITSWRTMFRLIQENYLHNSWLGRGTGRGVGLNHQTWLETRPTHWVLTSLLPMSWASIGLVKNHKTCSILLDTAWYRRFSGANLFGQGFNIVFPKRYFNLNPDGWLMRWRYHWHSNPKKLRQRYGRFDPRSWVSEWYPRKKTFFLQWRSLFSWRGPFNGWRGPFNGWPLCFLKFMI